MCVCVTYVARCNLDVTGTIINSFQYCIVKFVLAIRCSFFTNYCLFFYYEINTQMNALKYVI